MGVKDQTQTHAQVAAERIQQLNGERLDRHCGIPLPDEIADIIQTTVVEPMQGILKAEEEHRLIVEKVRDDLEKENQSLRAEVERWKQWHEAARQGGQMNV